MESVSIRYSTFVAFTQFVSACPVYVARCINSLKDPYEIGLDGCQENTGCFRIQQCYVVSSSPLNCYFA
jgi:NAD-dependent dihydropyrimidine dehydrogenase PreA subunit